MRIGLNLLYLVPDEVGGTRAYAEALIKALAEADRENSYTLFLNPAAARLPWPQAPNFKRVVARFPARRRVARYAWEQFVLPLQLLRHRIDVVHSLGYVSPLYAPCPSIVTICDLNFIALRDTLPRGKQTFLGYFVRQSAQRARHLLTISHFSQEQITKYFGIVRDKITVTPLGPREASAATALAWDEMAAHYKLERPYIAAFGSLRMHKNLTRLVRAFHAACADLPHRLLLIGHLPEDPEAAAELRAAIEQGPAVGRVVLTGYVPSAHIMSLLAHADLFAFPSWYEGFGLPALDAQQVGVPVVCSRAASLPEVAGAGAEYFDPFDVDEMAAAIRTVLTQPEKRDALIEQGHENLRRFSWQQTAELTLQAYHCLAHERGRG